MGLEHCRNSHSGSTACFMAVTKCSTPYSLPCPVPQMVSGDSWVLAAIVGTPVQGWVEDILRAGKQHSFSPFGGKEVGSPWGIRQLQILKSAYIKPTGNLGPPVHAYMTALNFHFPVYQPTVNHRNDCHLNDQNAITFAMMCYKMPGCAVCDDC